MEQPQCAGHSQRNLVNAHETQNKLLLNRCAEDCCPFHNSFLSKRNVFDNIRKFRGFLDSYKSNSSGVRAANKRAILALAGKKVQRVRPKRWDARCPLRLSRMRERFENERIKISQNVEWCRTAENELG